MMFYLTYISVLPLKCWKASLRWEKRNWCSWLTDPASRLWNFAELPFWLCLFFRVGLINGSLLKSKAPIAPILDNEYKVKSLSYLVKTAEPYQAAELASRRCFVRESMFSSYAKMPRLPSKSQHCQTDTLTYLDNCRLLCKPISGDVVLERCNVQRAVLSTKRLNVNCRL